MVAHVPTDRLSLSLKVHEGVENEPPTSPSSQTRTPVNGVHISNGGHPDWTVAVSWRVPPGTTKPDGGATPVLELYEYAKALVDSPMTLNTAQARSSAFLALLAKEPDRF